MVRPTTTISAPVAAAAPVGAAALGVPGYRLVLAAGWFWQMARWSVSFVGAFVANDLSGSARMVQLTGVAMWAPLLFGGVLGGVVSDRFDRRRTVITQFMMVIPLALLLGALSASGRLELWMVYPFMTAIGISWVIDMTSRRALIYDLVGPSAIDNAMSLEMLSSSTGLALGALLGGTVIGVIGIDAAFVMIAALLGMSMALFVAVPRPSSGQRQPGAGGPARSGVADLLGGLRMLRTEAGLLSVLGVTACINFFYFSFSPLVQVVGDRLGVGPALLGLLAAMLGLGMMTGSLLMIWFRPRRRGRAYVGGALCALVLALGFVATDNYVATAAFLYFSAIGMGFFGATQGVLSMATVSDDRRGRALGLLSMAIGVLPIGMIALGELAEVLAPPRAIAAFCSTGALLLVLWVWRHPEVLAMRSDGDS